MEKLVMFLQLLSFYASAQTIENPENILNFLLKGISYFKNPYCATKYLRADQEDNDVLLASGYVVTKVEISDPFEIRNTDPTTISYFRQITFTYTAGESKKEYSINCLLR